MSGEKNNSASRTALVVLAAALSLVCLGIGGKMGVDWSRIRFMGKDVEAHVSELVPYTITVKGEPVQMFTGTLAYEDGGPKTAQRPSPEKDPLNPGEVIPGRCASELCYFPRLDKSPAVLIIVLLLMGGIFGFAATELRPK
ncbi:MAG: hypothetical protein ACXWQO_09940 [Bdellovibrionota bacterium]